MGEAKRRKKLDANYGVVPKCRKKSGANHSKSSAEFKNLEILFDQLPKNLEHLKNLEDVSLKVKQNPQKASFDKSLKGLEQIEEIIIKAQQNPQEAFVFVTNKLPAGPEFIWRLGQKNLGVLFFCLEEKSNLMKVQVNSPTYGDELDYVRVEKSILSDKWQIIGQPPGAFKSRCLAIYESKDEAIEVKNLLLDEVRRLNPKYWDCFTMDKEYLDLMRDISEYKDFAEAVSCGAFLSKMLSKIEPE